MNTYADRGAIVPDRSETESVHKSCVAVVGIVLGVVALGTACGPPPLCGADGVVNESVILDEDRDVLALGGCTSIVGDLRITGTAPPPGFLEFESAPVTSLRGLESLASVSGAVGVVDAPALTDFAGLGGLEEIGGDFIVCGTAFDGLGALARVNGALTIGAAQAFVEAPLQLDAQGCAPALGVSSLAGLTALTSVGGLRILRTDLVTLAGLDALANVGVSGLFIAANTNLRDVEGLGALVSVEGDVVVDGNPVLAGLNGLGALASIGGALSVGANLDGLAALTTINGALRLTGGDLTDISGLSSLASIGGGLIIDGTAIVDLAALDDVTVAGDVLIKGNTALVHLAGLGGVRSIASLTITGNAALLDLQGLDGLTNVSGNVTLGKFSASFFDTSDPDPVLTTLDGLGALSTVGGDVTIAESGLTSIAALRSLRSIGGSLVVGAASTDFGTPPLLVCPFPGNDVLPSLGGLGALQSVGVDVSILCNPALRDISALGALGLIGGSFAIVGNPALSVCDVDTLTRRLRASCECSGNDNGPALEGDCPIRGEECAAAIPLIGPNGGTIDGDTRGASNDYAFGSIGGGCTGQPTNGGDVVYSIDIPAGGNPQVFVEPDSNEIGLAIYFVSTCPFTTIGQCISGDQGVAGAAGNVIGLVGFGPTTMFVVVDSVSVADEGSFTLTWAM